MKNLSFVFVAVFILFFVPITLFSELNDDLFYSLDDLTFTKYEDYDVVELRGCNFSTRYIGAPGLPATAISFLIPQDRKVKKVNFINVERVKVPGTYNIIPKQPPRLTDGSSPPPFVEPEAWYYLSFLSYPSLQYEIMHEGFRSEYRIVTLRIYPLVYEPFTESLLLSTHIRIELELEQDVNWGVSVKRRSEISQRRIENLIKALVVNPEDVDGYCFERFTEEGKPDLNKLEITDTPSLQGRCIDYVIITSVALKQSFQELADWKTKKGIVTVVKSESWMDEHYMGCDRQERIRNFIKDAHSNWGTDYFLLGGDTDIIPIRVATYTDLYYSDLEGSWNENNNNIFGEGPIYVNISGLDFVDEYNGWCVSGDYIFRTFNGGENWEIQVGSGADISAIDENNAWVVGGGGSILHTTDGGYTWQEQVSNVNISLLGVDFTDLLNGWAVGKGTIIHTENGGSDWWIQLELVGNEAFADVSFDGNSNGWAVGSKKTPSGSESIIYRTTDGGDFWFPQRTIEGEILNSIQAISPSEAWVSGRTTLPTGRILHTIDGGNNWIEKELGTAAITDILFVSSLEGWCCTGIGEIYHTIDGGDSWDIEKTVPFGLNAMDFINQQIGWIAGERVCLHTTNSGAEWTEYYFPQLGDTSIQEYDPDVFVGRVPVKTTEQVETFTNKVLCYEKTPPMNDDYLNRILFLAADLGPGIYDALISKEKFQDKDWYPTEFFHKYEMYGPKVDPGSPPQWEGDELITREGVMGKIKEGYHFINHMDHSNPYAMGTYSINW